MHQEKIELWQHQHLFNIEKKSIEKRTLVVVIVSMITMLAEIFFGWLTNSMALYADGWHMGTHAFALGISLMAYILARKLARDHRFTFGSWKIEILGAYSSAIVLGIVGLFMIFTSVERIINPLDIHYQQALFVAVIGLTVNILSAVILNNGQQHHSGDNGEHDLSDPPHEHDLNQKSAYLHVLADALTSVLAIIALLGAKLLKFNWLDPIMGIVGAGLVIRWSVLLLKDTANILIEREMDSPLVKEIMNEIEADGDSKISDIHIWQVAQNKYACIVSIVAKHNDSIEEYKKRLEKYRELSHVTVELYPCK